MRKRLVGGLITLFCGTGAMAQNSIVRSLETPVSGQGAVTVHQDERLTEWLKKGSVPAKRTSASSAGNNGSGTHNSSSVKKTLPVDNKENKLVAHRTDSVSVPAPRRHLLPSEVVKRSGYRVQIYSGPATREAKNQAASAAAKARQYFPDVAAYPIFVSPRWVCVVGDFLTHEEAASMKQRIHKSRAFNESTIVRSQIIVPQ